MAALTSFAMQACKFVPALSPTTMAGAADGDWVSLKGYDRCGILIHIDQGAVNTTAITVDIGTLVAGPAVTAGITLNDWWSITDTAIGTDAGTNSDTWVKGAAAALITSSATGTNTASLYYIEIDADDLSTGSAFAAKTPCLQLKLGASNVANIISAVYILHPSRYAEAVSPTPSAIID